MFERKVDFVKIYARQNGMSVKKYRAYMQACIEDMQSAEYILTVFLVEVIINASV